MLQVNWLIFHTQIHGVCVIFLVFKTVDGNDFILLVAFSDGEAADSYYANILHFLLIWVCGK